MKKSLYLIGTILASVPLISTVSCSTSTSTKNTKIITSIIQNEIEKKINSINEPLGKLLEGKTLFFHKENEIKDAIKSVTDNAILDYIEIKELDKTSGVAKEVFETDPILKNKTYSVNYILAPVNGFVWEGKGDISKPKSFSGPIGDSIASDKSLEESLFTNLKFSNIQDLLMNQGLIENLLVDSNGKPWENKVNINLNYMEYSSIGMDSWQSVSQTDVLNPGIDVRARVFVSPKGNYAWKTGDPFETREMTNLIKASVQFNVNPTDLEINFSKIGGTKHINIQLLPGFWKDKTSVEAGESYIEVLQRVTTTQESQDPATFNDYISINYKSPDNLPPYEKGKVNSEYKIDLNLPQDKRFANFKVIYKDFFKNELDFPFSIYDSKFTENMLPYIGVSNFHKIDKEGDDLVSYTYSIPYNL